MFRLPKVHKGAVPLRPMACTVGAPTYAVAKLLMSYLVPIVGRCTHHLKNSDCLVKSLGEIRVTASAILVSFDVVSLITKVPLNDSLNILSPHMTSLLCLNFLLLSLRWAIFQAGR